MAQIKIYIRELFTQTNKLIFCSEYKNVLFSWKIITFNFEKNVRFINETTVYKLHDLAEIQSMQKSRDKTTSFEFEIIIIIRKKRHF